MQILICRSCNIRKEYWFRINNIYTKKQQATGQATFLLGQVNDRFACPKNKHMTKLNVVPWQRCYKKKIVNYETKLNKL